VLAAAVSEHVERWQKEKKNISLSVAQNRDLFFSDSIRNTEKKLADIRRDMSELENSCFQTQEELKLLTYTQV
jgi:hypothetical protein